MAAFSNDAVMRSAWVNHQAKNLQTTHKNYIDPI